MDYYVDYYAPTQLMLILIYIKFYELEISCRQANLLMIQQNRTYPVVLERWIAKVFWRVKSR